MKKKLPFNPKTIFFVTFSILIGICNSYTLNAGPKRQKLSSKRKYQVAEKFLDNQNYIKAAGIYKELLEKSSQNPDLNFKLGICYLNIVSQKEKSVNLFENAIRYTSSKNNVPVDFYFNLAKAYHTNYRFKEALKVYQNLMQIISPQNMTFRNEIKREIEMCKNGIDLIKNPVNISIVNMGNKINTRFAEHSPGVTADESTIVFTSRRKGTGSKIDSDGQFFEDIYISHKENGTWSVPEGIQKFNTIDHDASISISADGQEIYIYKAGFLNRKESEGGDIYVSRLEGDTWTDPEKLGPNINSKSKESHISISADVRTIFFSSSRSGGYGGMDIYTVSKLPNGKWGRAKNLGPVINTEYDDDAPFIHSDGKTLYFSSSGHKTMGGLDIFKSSRINGRWSEPINIGYPINSTDDDIYYTPTPDGKRAYFASYRKGSLGRTDIFLIKTPDNENVGLFVLKGKVVNTNGEPVGNAKITVSRDKKTIGIYNPNSASGKFLFIVDAGKKYDIEVVAEGYRTFRTVLNIPPEYANKENRSIITLLPLTLRTKEEADYPKSRKLINFKDSKIKTTPTPLLTSVSIPKNKKFADRPIIEPEPEEQPIIKTQKINLTKPDNEKARSEIYYTIQIMALKLPVEAEFFDNLDNLKVFRGTDGFTRYTYRKFKSYRKAVTEMNRMIRMGYWDAFIRTVISDQLLYSGMKYSEKTTYTIQVMALRNQRPLSYFNDLGEVKMFTGTDGIHRYTYKTYHTKNEAILDLGTALKKGYWDAFVRKSLWGEQLPDNQSFDQENYYTIQVMALRNARSLNYFDNLGRDNMKKYKGSDGLTRYTFREFPTISNAKNRLSSVTKKGYFDAFVRKVRWYSQH